MADVGTAQGFGYGGYGSSWLIWVAFIALGLYLLFCGGWGGICQ